jgi:hypothetical protein
MRAFLNVINDIPHAEERPLETPPAAAPQVAANASGRLLGAEQKAQAAGRGVWRE